MGCVQIDIEMAIKAIAIAATDIPSFIAVLAFDDIRISVIFALVLFQGEA